MPNAAAHFDDDFGIEEPVRKRTSRRSAAGKAGSAKRKKKGRSRFAFVDMQRVSRYAAIAMSAMVVVGILVNALIMQKGRHPAPLFGKSISLGASAAAPKPAASAPAPKKAEVAAAPVPAAPRVERTIARSDEDARTSDDPIGRLLQSGSTAADRPSAKTVLGVQRALAKLGFTVKQTGTFGPQTRKAIEQFEKDRHLTIKGEVNRRLVKLLASESHIKIER